MNASVIAVSPASSPAAAEQAAESARREGAGHGVRRRAVVVERDPRGDAFAERQELVEAVEGEHVDQLLGRIERAEARRLAPPAEPLARVLGSA
jgi:hypothetical protein